MTDRVPVTDPFGNLIGYVGGSGIGCIGAVVVAVVIGSALLFEQPLFWVVAAIVGAMLLVRMARYARKQKTISAHEVFLGILVGSVTLFGFLVLVSLPTNGHLPGALAGVPQYLLCLSIGSLIAGGIALLSGH